MISSRLRYAAVAVLLALTIGCGLGGWEPVEVDRADVLGEWVGADGGELSIMSGGDFTVTNMVGQMVPEGTGRWILDGGEVALSYSGSGVLVSLYAARAEVGLLLWAADGDPDEGADYVFARA